MRYWLICMLIAMASIASAEDNAGSEWDGWDDLPEDILNLGGASSAEQLSQQLDTLIQQNPGSAEVDRLLELWLEQASISAASGDRQPIPLQTLIELVEPGQPVPQGNDNGHNPERLQQLLQGLPANPGANAGSGPPIDLPPLTGNSSESDLSNP